MPNAITPCVVRCERQRRRTHAAVRKAMLTPDALYYASDIKPAAYCNEKSGWPMHRGLHKPTQRGALCFPTTRSSTLKQPRKICPNDPGHRCIRISGGPKGLSSIKNGLQVACLERIWEWLVGRLVPHEYATSAPLPSWTDNATMRPR